MTLATDAPDITGEFRVPVNSASGSRGSIHDNATASKLGFKGGTVAGSIHMDQFVPLAVKLYGEDWWKHGNMSFYFRQATVDRETVRALARKGDPHARLWMENEAGALIAEGSASVNPADANTVVQNLMASQSTSGGDLRILKNVKVGDEVNDIEVTMGHEGQDRRLQNITETMPQYEGDHAVVPPSMHVGLYRGHAQEKLYKTDGPAVGLFGAIELQQINGPVRIDTPYVVRAKVLALSESPKTENVWYRAWAADKATGQDVSSMLMYLRYMKGSSKHWSE